MSSIPPVVPEGTRVTLSSMPDDFHHHFRDGEVCADVPPVALLPLAEGEDVRGAARVCLTASKDVRDGRRHGGSDGC